MNLLRILVLLFSTPVLAQDYPARPITAIVPFSTGSASDVMARLVLERMGNALGQKFVVDNRPAAGGVAGTLASTRAAPDGYTIVMGAPGPMVINKILMKDLGYDPEKDFEPISLYAVMPNIVTINAKLPAKTLAEFIDYAKKNPMVAYGSVGNGSSQHLAGELFSQLAGVQMQHVPYRVTTQLQADFLAGTVPAGFQLLPNVIGGLKSGQLRALAVTSKQRLAALPEVPTAAEAGVGNFESAAWFGFLAPKGTPRAAIDRLNKEVVAAVADSTLRARSPTSAPSRCRRRPTSSRATSPPRWCGGARSSRRGTSPSSSYACPRRPRRARARERAAGRAGAAHRDLPAPAGRACRVGSREGVSRS